MFITALSVIENQDSQLKQPSGGEWLYPYEGMLPSNKENQTGGRQQVQHHSSI